jgi:hypothetical protein
MMSELKPCPFCGGDAEEDASSFVEYHGHEHQDSTIKCTSCGIEMTVYAHDITSDFPCSCCHDIPAEARKRWNRRAPVSTPQQSAQRASVDTTEFRIVLDNWAGALHSCDHRTRTVYAKQAYNALIAHINAWGSAGSGAIPRLQTKEQAQQAIQVCNGFADTLGDDEQHPLFPMMDALMDAIAAWERADPELREFFAEHDVAAPSPAPQGEQA